jgi:hypothetical protein
VVALGGRVHGVAEVAQQVPAVRDLDRVRRAAAHAVGVGPGAVARDDLDAGVRPEPCRQGLGPAVRQEVHHPAALQVDEDGPVPVAAAPGPVVDRQHPRGRTRLRDRVVPARQPQQGVGAGRHGEPRRQARAGLAAQGEAEVALLVAQPARSARRRRGGVGQAFGEGPPRAGGVQAVEPSGPDAQRHRTSLPGQVAERAVIPAVHPPRRRGAAGAGG